MSFTSNDHAYFVRRFNDDTTVDSICNRCFETVSHCHLEADLARAENRHVCIPWRLEHYRDLSKEIEEYRTGKRDEAGA